VSRAGELQRGEHGVRAGDYRTHAERYGRQLERDQRGNGPRWSVASVPSRVPADEEPDPMSTTQRVPLEHQDLSTHMGVAPLGVSRDARWRALGTQGLTVWLTGLPAAGKSTLGAAVEDRLVRAGRAACWLDGDRLRAGLNCDLAFDVASRAESVRRTAEVAYLLADAGMITVVSLVSPYAAGRAQARALHERDGLTFFEVWISTPLVECERRDPKGLYARARCGELRGMTGIDDPYEEPTAPDLELSGSLGIEHSTASVLALIDTACTSANGVEPARDSAGDPWQAS
jgi:adenylyl-sulfate kinase